MCFTRFPLPWARTPLLRSVLQEDIRRIYDLPLPKRKSAKVRCGARACARTEDVTTCFRPGSCWVRGGV